MNCSIDNKLPKDWKIVSNGFETDESGNEALHFSALGPDEITVDIYIGSMPEGETAEDQAFANYAESVGFDDEDPEGFNPVCKTKFNGRSAWYFDAFGENESSIRIICQEVKKGFLGVFCLETKDDRSMEQTLELLEKSIRIKI